MDEQVASYESGLPDLGSLSVHDVLLVDDSVLSAAIRRIWYETDHPGQVLAGWSSVIDEPPS
jgi:hypothetical protein